jgi:hypothetical protein
MSSLFAIGRLLSAWWATEPRKIHRITRYLERVYHILPKVSSETGLGACAAGASGPGQGIEIGERETARDRWDSMSGRGWWAQEDEFAGIECAADDTQVHSGWLGERMWGLAHGEGRSREEGKGRKTEKQAGSNSPVQEIPDRGIRVYLLSDAP